MNATAVPDANQIDPFIMRLCVWTALALVAMTVVGFGWCMGYVPPPATSMTPEQSLAFVKEHQTSILLGAALCTFFWSFWVTWAAPLIIYIRRMERAPVLTYASLANVGGGAAVITVIAVSWTWYSSMHAHVFATTQLMAQLQAFQAIQAPYTLHVEPVSSVNAELLAFARLQS